MKNKNQQSNTINNIRPSSPRSVAVRGIGAAPTLYPAIFRTKTLRDDVSGRTECVAQGFTLIELLVVVLIIGILAAVAVPQYRVAVEKSRVIQLLTLVKAVVTAEQVYYLTNNAYARDFGALDIQLPVAIKETQVNNKITALVYKDFYCEYTGSADSVKCRQKSENLLIEHYFKKKYPLCFAKKENTLANKVCRSLGGKQEHSNDDYIIYAL